jgi:hypothetical protein
VRRFDRKREGRKTSNEEGYSPADPEVNVGRRKDGETRRGSRSGRRGTWRPSTGSPLPRLGKGGAEEEAGRSFATPVRLRRDEEDDPEGAAELGTPKQFPAGNRTGLGGIFGPLSGSLAPFGRSWRHPGGFWEAGLRNARRISGLTRAAA